MKHIDVFVIYKYGHKIFPELTPKMVSMVLTQTYDFPFTPERLEWYCKQEPKTKYIVHALRDKGIQPQTIAEWLDVHQSTVSYHLSKPLKNEYVNAAIQMEIKHKEMEEDYNVRY